MNASFITTTALLVLVAGCDGRIDPQLCVTGVEAAEPVCDRMDFDACFDAGCSAPPSDAEAIQIHYRAAIEVSEGQTAEVEVHGPCASNSISAPMVDGRLRLVRPLPAGASCFFSVEVELRGTTVSEHFSGGQCDEVSTACLADAATPNPDGGDAGPGADAGGESDAATSSDSTVSDGG